jgi:plasmid stability protein
MPQLIVRKLEASIVRRLRSRAAKEGVSVEEAHRRVLRQALLGKDSAAVGDFVDYLRSIPDVDFPIKRQRDLPRSVEF